MKKVILFALLALLIGLQANCQDFTRKEIQMAIMYSGFGNLHGINLYGANLEGIDLSNLDLTAAILVNAICREPI